MDSIFYHCSQAITWQPVIYHVTSHKWVFFFILFYFVCLFCIYLALQVCVCVYIIYNDSYGQIMSYMLASGAAAGHAVTVDYQNKFDPFHVFSRFYVKAYVSASVLLIAFLFTATLSMFSCMHFPRKNLKLVVDWWCNSLLNWIHSVLSTH